MEPTLLIGEDDAELAELYQNYLTRCGYRALTASGGVECLSIIRNEAPSLIIASVNMPWGGVDGLVDYLQEESYQNGNPCVILTGCTSDENVAELCEQPCVFRYLRKPFLMGRLLDCIHAIESDGHDRRRPEPSSRPRQFAAACDTSRSLLSAGMDRLA
jgi:DNA-binding response OmpR family regulator